VATALAGRVPTAVEQARPHYVKACVAAVGKFTGLATLAFPALPQDVDWIVCMPKPRAHHWAGVLVMGRSPAAVGAIKQSTLDQIVAFNRGGDRKGKRG
jgi:hypothetical protein